MRKNEKQNQLERKRRQAFPSLQRKLERNASGVAHQLLLEEDKEQHLGSMD
jgi:hypothetical protein